jgi:putative PIN family toxin of toxin-antitoxin system
MKSSVKCESKDVMIKAVLDTNVLVSALLSEAGVPNQVLRLAGRAYQLFISDEILEEAGRVLRRSRIRNRVGLTEDRIQAFLSTLQMIADIVKDPPSLQVIEDDPDDNSILACAIGAGTDYLVSGDIHLKQLKNYKGIKVISASEFLSILKE